jgi:dephospho-CoA kinase
MSKQWPHKTVIGLTGNIATGKSAVMGMAAEKGALTLDADQIVHDILEHDAAVQAAIGRAFGADVRRANGTIDRAALASIVFNDEDALRDLERLVHPSVRRAVHRTVDESDASVVMIEAIKLLEGELVEIVDEVWVTRCPRRVQIERLVVCRGMDAETAQTRVAAQNPQETKVARADVVIDTDGTMAETKAQFETAWKRVAPARAEPTREASGKANTPPTPAPPVKTVAAAPGRAAGVSLAGEVIVRRARPSDIPAIILLIQRATQGTIKRKRSEMLAAFSERSYLLGQNGTDVTTAVGWLADSTTAVCIDEFYVYPLEALDATGTALLAEIERSANELICEIAMVFLPEGTAGAIRDLFISAGYRPMRRDQMHRVWQRTVDERQPEGTFILAKVLRDVRVS